MSPDRLTQSRPPGLTLSLILLLAAIAISFRSAPFLDFVDYDDPVAVLDPSLRGGLTMEAIRFALTASPANLWHPLTFLSHALDFEIYGSRAGGHHLTNLFWHLASCVVVLVWLRRFTGEDGLALAVVLLFAIHPLRVESVIWISERKDVLSLFFYLLTVALYSEWAAAEGARRRRFYLLAVVAATCGVLSKPSLMTLPAILFLVDFWPLRRLAPSDWKNRSALRRRVIEKTPFILLAFAAATIAWMTWSGKQELLVADNLGLLERGGFAALTYLTYLSRTFLPVDLAAFEPYPPEAPLLPLFFALFSLSFVTVLAIRHYRESPWFCAGWLWFLATILPGSGLITISDHFAPDRYTYPAHVGLGIALVWGIATRARILRVPAMAGWITLGLVLIPLSLLTARQSLVWRDSESLWRHAVEVKGPNYLSRNQLGLALVRNGRIEEGLGQLREAVVENPDNPLAKANLAMACLQGGLLDEGVNQFLQTIPGLPGKDAARESMVESCLAAGREDLATTLWTSALAEHPAKAKVRIGAADFFYGIGSHEEALLHYHEAVKLDPVNSHAALSVGALLIRRGSVDEAIPWLERAIATAPDEGKSAEAHRTLAQARILQRSWKEAIETYETGLDLAPDRLLLRNELAQLLLDCPDTSLRAPLRALELAGDLVADSSRESGEKTNPRYLRTYVRALVANGRGDEAKKFAKAGLESVAALRAIEPLKAPWTVEELDRLTEFFRGSAGTEEP